MHFFRRTRISLAGTTAAAMIAGLMVTAVTPAAMAATAKLTSALSSRHKFDIKAQPLNESLRALSTQSGIRILFPFDEVAQFRGRSVSGWLSTEQALDQLLAGTPLKHSEAGDGVIALAPTGNRSIAQRSRLSVQFAQAATPSSTATMTMAPVDVAEDDQVDATPIIVTGTRQTTRTVADSLAPIDVLGKADLEASGKQSVRDLLGTLVPSISVSNGGAGASFAVKTLSLRGLSGDQVLVLVNGKRRHNTATLFINGTTQNGQSPPDLDLIPGSSIQQIEVLRDGASAQYGSDAIAGVINVITKKGNGGSATFTGGATGRGDGISSRIQADYGFGFANGGHFNLAGEGYIQERTQRGVLNPSVFYAVGDPREPAPDSKARDVNQTGQPQVTGFNLSYDAATPVGDTLELYSFGTASKRHADAWLTFRTPTAANNVIQVYPNGYSPHLHLFDKDYQGVVGIRGDLAENFHADLSTSYSKNSVRNETGGLNASMGVNSPTYFYIGTVKSTEWTNNLDLQYKADLGLAEPLFIAAGGEYRENSYTIVAGEPASYIDGGSRTASGAPRQAGSQGVTGFPLESAGKFTRNSWSAYLNLEQTIVEGFDVALAGRHEDYSDFGTTDTGKASIRIEPIKGIAFRGTASTGFRAPTLQQIHYSSSSTIGVLLPGATVTTLAPVRALPVDDPAAIALGSQPLKPEKSTNFSAGLVLTPTNRLNITIDAYQIKIEDRILLGGVLTGAAAANGTLNAVGALLQNAGLSPFQSGFYFSNAADTRTRGLDIVGTYRANLGGLGSATFSLSANFNKTKFTRLEVPAVLAASGLSLIDRARQGDFTKGTPRDKFVGNVLWNVDDFSLNLRATRYGEVTMVSTLPANDDTVTAKVLFDLEVGYKITDKIKISAGGNNLFDVYPNVLKAANQGAARFAYYNTYAPYGISGGYYYGKLSFTF